MRRASASSLTVLCCSSSTDDVLSLHISEHDYAPTAVITYNHRHYHNINIQGMQLQQVDTLPHPGSLITENAEGVKELSARVSDQGIIEAAVEAIEFPLE